MTLGARLLTRCRGELVGTDPYGNRYYRERGAKREGSKVPPEWHAWLHHTVDLRIPTISASHSGLKSATCSD